MTDDLTMNDTHPEDLLVEYIKARAEAQRQANTLVDQLWDLYQFIRSMNQNIADETAKQKEE